MRGLYQVFNPGRALRALLRQSTDEFQMTQEAVDLVGQVKKRISQPPVFFVVVVVCSTRAGLRPAVAQGLSVG